ncbi:MAG: DUF3418 domain-containing protein, partial [Proteobacteria bacterium]|nr:DUF3418 domain-containing protein [Pseudomonadota bacterium]
KAADDPAKEEQKAAQLNKYTRHLDQQLSGLCENTSEQKTALVEEFYWMLEEYKISLFAQEIKTLTKISTKKLDQVLIKLSTMI